MLKVVTLCSGYDSQCLALERLKEIDSDFDYELLAWSEIDPYAIKAHDALFPKWKGRNLGDMTVCDYSSIENDVDLLFYSTPCQSLSSAGKQKGMRKGDDAASSLIWHTERAIRELSPKILILENVSAILNKRNINDFNQWMNALSSYGYRNFYALLNSKDYGIPQNRERLFLVSIKDGSDYIFGNPIELKRKFKDLLEQDVSSVYYLPNDKVNAFVDAYSNSDDSEYSESKVIILGKYSPNSAICGRVMSFNGLAPTIMAGTHGYAFGTFLESYEEGKIRRLTPRECFRLMGLRGNEIDILMSQGFSDTQMYKMAGNSIVVDCLVNGIFKTLFLENNKTALF